MMNDKDNLEEILKKVTDDATNFFNTIQKRAVSTTSNTIKYQGLSSKGLGTIEALNYFNEYYADKLSGSNGPRYLGFVTGGATPASIAGDWLTSVYDQNLSTSKDSIAGAMELETLSMLKELFHLDAEYSGVFVSGATMSSFVGLAEARQWAGHKEGKNISVDGLFGLTPIKILSGTPHSSIYKSMSMLGLGRNSMELIDCQTDREAVDVFKLEQKLKLNADSNCIVVANSGTVNTGDFDDLIAIGKLKENYDFWLHVDAAFGGFAACSPSYEHLTEGINYADSITIDGHKWLNVPYDSAMHFTRHKNLEVEVFQNNAVYLGSDRKNPDFCDLTPENSRRFRALPAWFSLKAYGKEGYKALVEQNTYLAKQLGERVNKSKLFTLLSPVRLNVACFTLDKDDLKMEDISHFLDRLHSEGLVFLTPTVYQGVPGIRASFSNWQTEEKDLDLIWNSLSHIAKDMIGL